jgi:hypothetical protein
MKMIGIVFSICAFTTQIGLLLSQPLMFAYGVTGMIVFGAVLWIYEKLKHRAFLKYARQPMPKGWLAEQLKRQTRESSPARGH